MEPSHPTLLQCDLEKMVQAADPGQLLHEFQLADITPKGAVLYRRVQVQE